MAAAYVIFSCALLTWFRWRQDLQGRSYPFVGISCLYVMWVLASGATIPMDNITLAVIAFAVWLTGSLIWSSKPTCVMELFVWLSYLVLFTTARTLPLELVAWVLVPNSAIMAGLQIYYQYQGRHDYTGFPIFGNSNHNSSFMLAGMFSAMWLAVHGVIFLWFIVLLIGVGIARSRCRGSVLAMLIGMGIATVWLWSEYALYVTILVSLASVVHGRRFTETIAAITNPNVVVQSTGMTLRQTYIEARLEIYLDALSRVHPRYIVGRGLNYFRDTHYGRVHNDTLELLGEVGIIGVFLLWNIFFRLHLDPVIVCFGIAFLISSMVFFPLRETQTATQFWVLFGAASGVSLAVPSYLILKATVCMVLVMIGLFIFTVFSNLVKWSVEHDRPDWKEK